VSLGERLQCVHANSRDPQFGPNAHWPERCEEWMRFIGWLRKRDADFDGKK